MEGYYYSIFINHFPQGENKSFFLVHVHMM